MGYKTIEIAKIIVYQPYKKVNEIFLILLPFLVLPSTYLLFQVLTNYFAFKVGYFLGFLFYWFFWCFLIPLVLLGFKGIKELFIIKKPYFGKNKLVVALLILPLLLGYGYAFPRAISQANLIIVISSIIISAINAAGEELLWRGLYLKVFVNSRLVYLFYSTFGFAIWHFAPLSVFANKAPGGAISFVAVSFLVGLIYAYAAKDQESITLTAIFHFFFDLSGLGGRIYF
jgi:membrane protease YdiL (CAAX protease family)